MFLETHEIRKMVITAAINRKNALKEELSDKFVFLKMDGCTRHRVNYLAINVQFIHPKNMLEIKTLAVHDTQAQHRSEFLQRTLETVLKAFDPKNSKFWQLSPTMLQTWQDQWKNSTKWMFYQKLKLTGTAVVWIKCLTALCQEW